MSDYFQKWQPVADDVISIIIAEHDAWIKAIDAGIVYEDLPPGAWREAYQNLISLRSEGVAQQRPLLDTELATICGPAVSVTWVAERAALYDDYRAGAFDESLEKLKAYGRGHRALAVTQVGSNQIRAALNNGLDIENATVNVVNGLQLERLSDPGSPTELGALLDLNQASMENDPVPGTKTGILVLDQWLDGLDKNEFLAWVAPYKSRKTSAAACAILAALKQGKQVDFFSFDERRENFIYRLEAVLMAEFMYHANQWEHPLNGVTAKMIRRAGKRWREWNPLLQNAFKYAFDTLKSYGKQLRIYDSKTCDATMRSIRGLARTDAAKLGGLDMIMVDHLQSLKGYRTTYEQVEIGSTDLHLLRGELDCIMWVLAQQNEDAIVHDDTGWSPKVKGGGGLASKADTVVVSKYMQGAVTDPKYLRVELRQAREEESRVFGYVEIHPPSGWITPSTVDVKKIMVNPDTWAVEEVQ